MVNHVLSKMWKRNKRRGKLLSKVASNQENFQQNNYKSQNYGQKPHIDKKSLFTKQSVGLIVGILLMAYGAMDVSFGELIGLVIAGVGAVIMFYTKS